MPKSRKKQITQYPFIFIIIGFFIFVTGFTLFWYAFHNTDISWNFMLFRDTFNTYNDGRYFISLENLTDNTTTGNAQITEIYRNALIQFQAGLFLVIIGVAVMFASVGYIFCFKNSR